MTTLNPQAQSYIPLTINPQLYLPILPSFSPFYYTSQPPTHYSHDDNYQYTLQSPFYSPPPPFYTTTFHIHHPSPHEATAASTQAAAIPIGRPTVLTEPKQPQVAVGRLERVQNRSASKRSSGFWREREAGSGSSTGRHERESTKTGAWKAKFSNRAVVLPLKLEENKTTVMIKNVPNKYTRELLMEWLDKHCKLENRKAANDNAEAAEQTVSAFDFLYLPMDFGTGCNKGYAFVNFTEPRGVWKFYQAFDKKAWDFYQSPKIREIVCAKIQGKEALIQHFDKSSFFCDSDEYLPVCFSPPRNGSGDRVKQTTVGKRIGSTRPF